MFKKKKKKWEGGGGKAKFERETEKEREKERIVMFKIMFQARNSFPTVTRPFERTKARFPCPCYKCWLTLDY